jgi:hypothetical protein
VKKKRTEKLGVVLFFHILERRRFFFCLSIPELFMFLSSVASREGGRISCFFFFFLFNPASFFLSFLLEESRRAGGLGLLYGRSASTSIR